MGHGQLYGPNTTPSSKLGLVFLFWMKEANSMIGQFGRSPAWTSLVGVVGSNDDQSSIKVDDAFHQTMNEMKSFQGDLPAADKHL